MEEENFGRRSRLFKNTPLGPAWTTFEAKVKVHVLPPAWQENLLRIGQEALTNTR